MCCFARLIKAGVVEGALFIELDLFPKESLVNPRSFEVDIIKEIMAEKGC
jgi:hypothetical protein